MKQRESESIFKFQCKV